MLRVSVRSTKPMRLSAGQDAMLAAVGPADTQIRPVMGRILFEVAILVENPLAVGRPAGAEVNMVGMPGEADALAAFDIADPDFVAAGTGQMKGHAPAIRTQAQPVGQAFTGAGEIAGIGPIEVH